MAKQTQTEVETTKTAPPPKAPAKKSAAKKKTAAKKSAAKKKTTAKKKAQAKEKAAPKKLEENLISEDDLNGKVEKINALIEKSETTRTSNDWKIGKYLSEIRSNVNDGTWTQVSTSMIKGIGGRQLGKSSIDKKMKLFNMFPKDEKRATAIGVGRLDKICRLPSVAEREEILKGISRKVQGEKVIVQVEDMTVAELNAWIDKYMAKKHPKKVKPPTQLFTKKLSKLAESLSKLHEEHVQTLKNRTFEPEQVAEIKSACGVFKEFVDNLEIQEGEVEASE